MTEEARTKGDVAIVAALLSVFALAAFVLAYLMLRPIKGADEASAPPSASSSAPTAVVPPPATLAPTAMVPAVATAPASAIAAAESAAPMPSLQPTVVFNHRPRVEELIDMEPPLPMEDVRQVLQAQQDTVRSRCHPAGSPPARARVVLHIEGTGVVSAVDPDPEGGDAALTSCVQGLAKTWRFPRNAAPTVVAVPYSFGG